MIRKQIIPLLLLAVTPASAQQTITLQISNPTKIVRTDAPVAISLSEYGDIKSALVTIDGNEIPCQLDDFDKDGVFDELAFVADLDKKQKKKVDITLYKNGTHYQGS